MQRLALLACLLVPVAFAGCKSEPAPATERELEPVDQDANGNPIATGRGSRPARDKETARPPRESFEGGPIITLVYVTIIRHNGRDRPSAVIFSSDPDCPYFEDKPRPSRVHKPTNGRNMLVLLDALREAGMDVLPHQDEKIDAEIAGERQFFVVRDGRRVSYKQSSCRASAEHLRAFDRCERVLVQYSQSETPFVETQGLAPIKK